MLEHAQLFFKILRIAAELQVVAVYRVLDFVVINAVAPPDDAALIQLVVETGTWAEVVEITLSASRFGEVVIIPAQAERDVQAPIQ